MAAVVPVEVATPPLDERRTSLVAAAAVTIAAEATEIAPGFTNFIAVTTEAGAWLLLAGTGDPALAARALKSVVPRLRPDREIEALISVGTQSWIAPFLVDGRVVGCAVLFADHDRVLPASEAEYLGQFADKAAVFLANAIERQDDALTDRLDEAVTALPRLLHAAARQPEMLAALGASLERAFPCCSWAVALRGVGQGPFRMVASGTGVGDEGPGFVVTAKQAVSADEVTVTAPRRGDVVPPGAFVALAAPLRDARMRCVGAIVVRVPGDCGVEGLACSRAITVISDMVSVALELAGVSRETRILQRRDAETGCLSPELLRDMTAALIDACSIGNKSAALLFIQAAGNQPGATGDVSTARSLKKFVDDETGADLSMARMGAWRYAILAPDRGPREAATLAGRLRWHLRTSDIGPIASSVGIAMVPLNGTTFDAVSAAASGALDEAISSGGDCERIAPPKLRPPSVTSGPVDTDRSIVMLHTLAEMINQLYFAGTNHSGVVAARASDIALRLGVPGDLLQQVTFAGELHDIGRALLAPELFITSTPTDAERRLVQTHVLLGARLVSNAGFPGAAECIAGMHERWDGSGEPRGAAGLTIPLGARILAAANTFETVLGGHGRGDSGLRAAITTVAKLRGRALDPEVVDSLLGSLKANIKRDT